MKRRFHSLAVPGAVLAIISTAYFISGIAPRVRAADHVFVNIAPTIDSMHASMTSGTGDMAATGFTPNEGRPRALYVRGTVTDQNGCSDIREIDVKVYRSGVGHACTQNLNNCYATSTQTLIGCNSGNIHASFETEVDLAHFAEPTDPGSTYESQYWFADATVFDAAHASYTAEAHFELNSLAALHATPDQIDYGTTSLGQLSKPQKVTFTNTGNRPVEGLVRADGDLASNLPGFSHISSTQVHVSLHDGFRWTDGTPMGNTDVLLPLNLGKQTTDTASSTAVGYFQLKMPASGVSGKYTNNVVFTARPY